MRRVLLCLTLLTPPAAAQDAAPLPRATVAQVEIAEIVQRIPISGTLVPREEVLVTPQVSGYPIQALNHDIGDAVAAGEVLARLDDRTVQAQLLQAEAELARARAAVGQAQSQIDSAEASAAQARTALDRTRTLRDGGTTTQANLDQAVAADLTTQAAVRTARDGLAVSEAQVQQAQAARDIARLNLANAVIRAPVSGIISERSGQVGAIAAASGAPIYRIIEDGVVEMEAEVIETALGSVETGDTAELDIAGRGTVDGTVRRISPTVNRTNRLGSVRIAVEAEALRPGLFASGWIVTDRLEGPTVPTTAVLSDVAGDYVLGVAGDGTLARRDVVAGLIWNDRQQIVSGLAPGDVVVARAGAFFAPGDRIDPTDEDLRAAEAER